MQHRRDTETTGEREKSLEYHGDYNTNHKDKKDYIPLLEETLDEWYKTCK